MWFTTFSGHTTEVGELAPIFELPSIDGVARVRLEDFRGRFLLLDFWASWCQPCRDSFPLYARLYEENSGRPFEILAINLDEHPEDARRFLQRYPVEYPGALDQRGEVAARYQLTTMPMSYLIDPEGTVVASYPGFRPSDMEHIRHEIDRNLGLD